MRGITVKMAAVLVMIVAVGLIAGAASAQAFPPGLFPTSTPAGAEPTPTFPATGPTQTPAGPGPTPTFPAAGPTPAQAGEAAITSGTGDKEFPAISGDLVVWYDNNTMSVGIYDASTGRTLPPPNGTYVVGGMRQIDVSGNTAVWTGLNATTMTTDIYLYDIASGRLGQITNDEEIQMWPSISGNLVCWNRIDFNTGMGEVYWQDTDVGGTAPLLLANETYNQLYPVVGGDTVAWLDDGEVGGRLDLAWASISSGQSMRASSQNNITSPPAVSSDGSRIVWVAESNTSFVVNLLDVGTMNIEQISGEGALAIAPVVDGNYVVWTDYRNGNGDIYLYDIRSGQERQVTSSSAEQAFPDISGDRIVWMGNDDGPWNIYLGSVGAGPQPTAGPSPVATSGPVYPAGQPTYGPVYPTGEPTGNPTEEPTWYPTEEPTYWYPTEDRY
ncbi:hypothetical protein F8E02_07975 [Methanoculleus sp. Wushi-C6]|uniref:Uncharacterized protein n=1 Tax=Methanoculleus caldifontis TaxID=2651577 RepID=A0ABU3X1N5_9EURY|nr:hypothetical protein [Methanoculleus sp. Wushi-C6]MDV2481946.1 hypothetical protein [Methanoculleus sp. Wushi-C6]